MKARVAASSGWPDERRTSWTIGGAIVEAARPAGAVLRCSLAPASRFFLHSGHSSPSGPEVFFPHAQRCSRAPGTKAAGISDAAEIRLVIDRAARMERFRRVGLVCQCNRLSSAISIKTYIVQSIY